MVLIYKSLDVCDIIVVHRKDWILECVQLVQLVQIFETERYAYYHKHGDVRLCTVIDQYTVPCVFHFLRRWYLNGTRS